VETENAPVPTQPGLPPVPPAVLTPAPPPVPQSALPAASPPPPQPVPLPAVPWTTRDVWLGLAALVLWLGLSLGLGLLLRYLSLDVDQGLVLSLLEALLILPAWWFTVHKYRVGWQTLGLRGFQGVMLGLGLALMLLAYAFNLLHNLLLLLLGLRIQPDYVGLFERLKSPWLLLVGSVLVAPVVEEIFFRGFVFAGLRQRFGWQKAALLSAAIFAVIHLTPAVILPIFVLGCFLAFIYHYSRSLWPAILMHMLVNGVSLGLAYYLSRWAPNLFR
jgi:membrane protease YdiL (CAAX protease family)